MYTAKLNVLILFKGMIVVYSDKKVCTHLHTDINRYTYIHTYIAYIRTTHMHTDIYTHTHIYT
jgi:hypothetical protein